MQEHATRLAGAIEAALPAWVERCVRRRAGDRFDHDPALAEAAREAGRRAGDEVGRSVRRLLERDIDEQATTPLALLRDAVRYPAAVLRDAGVAPVARDDFARGRFPDDDYDLTPAHWSDVDESLVEPGIAWGAAKAFTHKQRHGAA